MQSFFEDVDAFFAIDSWRVRIDECLGEGARGITERMATEVTVSDAELRRAYAGIYQTIDGSFLGSAEGIEQCRLLAVDSSYWEVFSSPEFEAHVLAKYGSYGA